MVLKVWPSFVNLMTLRNKTVLKALYAELCENSTAGKCPLLYSSSNTLYCSTSHFVLFFFLVENKKKAISQRDLLCHTGKLSAVQKT